MSFHNSSFQNSHFGGVTRRHFLRNCQVGLGGIALASLMQGDPARAVEPPVIDPLRPLAPRPVHHPAKAKRVIVLHMAGGPPQQELWDYKPKLQEFNNKPCPDEYLEGERFAFIKGHPKLLGSPYQFARHGESGQSISELLPHLSEVVDDLCVVRAMHTDQFNHAPAQMLLYTGHARFGHPSMGSWATYGLGSENEDLPGFVALVSGGKVPSAGKSVWGSGFLPSVFQGVQCRTQGDPVLYVSNPDGMSRKQRRQTLDAIRDMNQMQLAASGDPETETRIAQYEMAYRMQVSVPEVMDISREPKEMLELYGATPGGSSFANNCLLGRRMLEDGVRFVQLFDWGWDCHGTRPIDDLMTQLPKKCQETDRPVAALIKDLKQRGMLDDTLVVWSGEFGRTPVNEARNGSKLLGRDHHPHAMSMFMAGGGIKPGMSYGVTDELGYFPVEDEMHIHDLQATILHLLGLDPFTFHFPFKGLDQRLIGPTDIARLHPKILA